MKIIMYGTEICEDCVASKAVLSMRPDIELDYRNITENTKILKEFLAYRDHEEMFREIKQAGKIGIPLFILEDDTKTFDISSYIGEDMPQLEGNACSLDGKGYC